MNPLDTAAGRHKEIARARERIAKAEIAHAESTSRVEQLKQEVGPAEYRDKQKLGEALVQEAREALSNEATMVAWLDSGSSGEAATDPLGGRQGLNPISFTRTLEALRQDCEQLANHPVTRTDPVASLRLELAHGAGAHGLQWEGGE